MNSGGITTNAAFPLTPSLERKVGENRLARYTNAPDIATMESVNTVACLESCCGEYSRLDDRSPSSIPSTLSYTKITMDAAMFNGALLRTVIGHVNAKQPTLSKRIAASVITFGLAAEADDRLSQQEAALLAAALDVFQDRLIDKAMSYDDKDSGVSKQHLGLYCHQCSNVRMLQMYEGLLVRLLPQREDLTSFTGFLNILSTVCHRLQSLKWMPTVRATFGPLSGRFLHKIASSITGVTDVSEWLSLMTAATHIVRTVHSLPPSATPITHQAIAKMQYPETDDAVRLLASEYLTSTTADKKTTQSWMQLMGSLLQFLKETTDILFDGIENAAFQWEDFTKDIDKEYALQTTHLGDASIMSIVKVFSGGMDLLERLLTMPTGCYPIPSEKILKLLIRTLSVHDGLITKDGMSPKSFEILGCLHGMQAMCWDMMTLLMHICGTSLLPYGRCIGDILNWSLQRTNQQSTVKTVLYQTAVEYLHLTGVAGVLRLQESVFTAMKHEMQLSSEGQHPNIQVVPRKSKKRKKASLEATLEADVEMLLSKKKERFLPSLCKADTSSQISVMDLATAMTEQGVCVLQDHLLQSMEQLIAVSCLHLLQANEQASDHVLLSTMRAMLQCVLGTTQHRPRLLTLAVATFSEGCRSERMGIRSACMNAMGQLDVLMHPRSMAWHPRLSYQSESVESMPKAVYFSQLVQESVPMDTVCSIMPSTEIIKDHPSAEQEALTEERAATVTGVQEEMGNEEVYELSHTTVVSLQSWGQLPTMDIDEGALLDDVKLMVHEPDGETEERPDIPSSDIKQRQPSHLSAAQLAEKQPMAVAVHRRLSISTDSEGPLPELDSGTSSHSADE